MQLGTVRHDGGTRAVRVDGDELVLLDAPDLGALLAGASDASADGPRLSIEDAAWAPVIPQPDKIICVGLNYRDHILEMGRELPSHPTCFAKFSGSLIGANDDIHLPPASVSTSVDWEVELCIVVGAPGRNIAAVDALDHVAGYTILNDVSVRDWQRRTIQFLAGKTFEHTTPVGPTMTTVDVLGDAAGLEVETLVDGVSKQRSTTDQLVFDVRDLIADLSTIITLQPGDLIATGTPGGVGAARTPPEFLQPGQEVVTRIEGIGELRNRCVRPA
jgi:acylpyruvate hydrolase